MIPLSDNFLDELKAIEGLDADALVKALDTPPSVSIRLNNRKLLDGPDFPDMEPVDWCADGRYLSERPKFTLDPLLHAGAYYVQDASSMIYQQIVDNLVRRLEADNGSQPLVALDFCAAPGGKTTAMINALPDGSTVVANEFVASRGKILRENLEKWGYPCVITTGAASSQYASLPPTFDIIAVDAPCSGEGMMRKDDDARRQWDESLVDSCVRLQREILSDLVGCLKPGGYLIFSTCTFNLSENERNSQYICRELELRPIKIDSLDIHGIEKPGRALLSDVEALRFMPHLTRGEGLYVSIFRKPDCPATEALCSPVKDRFKKRVNPRKGANELTDPMRRELNGWCRPEVSMRFELSGTLVTAIPAISACIVDKLRQHRINVTGEGLPIAELKGRSPKMELVPDSRFALNLAMRQDAFAEAELSEEDALRFLRRESFRLGENIPKGYVVVKYIGMPLGMMKNLGNRANNLFPSAWRIKTL